MESIDCVAKNTQDFEHKFDKVLKKHPKCLIKDFEIIKQTILTRKEELLKESPKITKLLLKRRSICQLSVHKLFDDQRIPN